MRTYYIFKINKSINPINEKRTVNTYKLLNKIYKYSNKDYKEAYKLYRKIVMPINKYKLDNYLLMNHINDFYYIKKDNIHELNSKKEKSKLIINNTYIKIITTSNISSFFKDMFSINNDFFVIDFKNKDYFYLEEFKVNLLAC